MEDYIYILLGIVWVVYSLYRANQKKKKARENVVEEAPVQEIIEPETSFSAIFDEFFDKKTLQEDDPIFNQPEPISGNDGSQYGFFDKNIKTDYKLDSIPVEEGERMFNKNAIDDFFVNHSISEDYEEIEDGESLDFDLRKAIIYSEILNRPNF